MLRVPPSMNDFAQSSQAKKDGFAYKIAPVPINKLLPSRYQSRSIAFEDGEELENLANSINTVGLLEDPLVRPDPEKTGFFEIISGHRRIEAASKYLGRTEIECKILEKLNEFDAFRLNLTENIQRSNLAPYEEGNAFLLCQKRFGLSDEEIGRRLHKSRQTIANKRELAVAANHYTAYADPSVSRAFLRHFSNSYKEILDQISDARMLKHAITMIARGGTIKNLQRFYSLFGKENYEGKSEAADHDSALDINRSNLERLLGRFQNEEEDNTPVKKQEFRCPSCNEILEVERKIIPKQEKVLFIINPASSGASMCKTVYSFPVYKAKYK